MFEMHIQLTFPPAVNFIEPLFVYVFKLLPLRHIIETTHDVFHENVYNLISVKRRNVTESPAVRVHANTLGVRKIRRHFQQFVKDQFLWATFET